MVNRDTTEDFGALGHNFSDSDSMSGDSDVLVNRERGLDGYLDDDLTDDDEGSDDDDDDSDVEDGMSHDDDDF